MCLNHEIVFETTVGDLALGSQFRDPDGNTYIVAEGYLIVRLDNGAVASTLDWVRKGYRKDVRLGRDSLGRLYAGRKLNGWAHGENGFALRPAYPTV